MPVKHSFALWNKFLSTRQTHAQIEAVGDGEFYLWTKYSLNHRKAIVYGK